MIRKYFLFYFKNTTKSGKGTVMELEKGGFEKKIGRYLFVRSAFV
jgi:hypothetical protein